MSTLTAQLFQMERQVIETFRVANAVTPQSAITPPAWPARAQRQIFERFSKKHALVATPEGRVWLDEPRYFAYMKWRMRALTIFTVAVVVIVISAIIFVP